MLGHPGHNTRPKFWLAPSSPGVAAWMTSQLNEAFVRKPRGPMMCLAYSFDMLPIGVCTTMHCHTSGRLVQEFNVCTVGDVIFWVRQQHHNLYGCLFLDRHSQGDYFWVVHMNILVPLVGILEYPWKTSS